MRVLLGIAALGVMVSGFPAQAQTASFGAVNAKPWVTTMPRVHRHHGGDGNMRGPGHHAFPNAYGYAGYLPEVYDSDFDGNREFDPDKWNDWWHNRPDRAFPRWMSRNADCSRRWYSGDVLTC